MGEKEGYIEIPGNTGILVPRTQYGKVVSFCLLEVGCCSPYQKKLQVEGKKELFEQFFGKQETGEVFQVYTGIAHYSPFDRRIKMKGLDFIFHYTGLNKKMFDRFSEDEIGNLCDLIKNRENGKTKTKRETVRRLFEEKNLEDLYKIIQAQLEIDYSTDFRGTLGEAIVVKDIMKNIPADMTCYPRAEINLEVSIIRNGKQKEGNTEIDVILVFYHDGKFQNFIKSLGRMKNIDLRLNGKLK